MVFCKGVFDWADGQIARWNNEESLGGHLLDCYGAKVNAICFSAALGFYSFRETEQIIYLYFLVGFCFISAVFIRAYASEQLLRSLLAEKILIKTSTNKRNLKTKWRKGISYLLTSFVSKSIKRFSFLRVIFDDRAEVLIFFCL